MIEISVVARCTQRNTPISPIKGIVGGVSRERALQAIRNDLIGILFNMLFNKGFKKASACRGPGACPCVCRRLQLAGGNRRRGRHEFGFHFCQICPASVGVFLAANWCQIESKMLRASVSVFSDKRTYTPQINCQSDVLKNCIRSCYRNNLTNRPSVGRNKKRFSEYSLNLFLLCFVRLMDKYRYIQ